MLGIWKKQILYLIPCLQQVEEGLSCTGVSQVQRFCLGGLCCYKFPSSCYHPQHPSSEQASPNPSFVIFLVASILLVESTLLKALETADQAPEAALVRDAPQQCFLLHSCCYPASSSTTVAPSVKAATVTLEVSRSLFSRGV